MNANAVESSAVAATARPNLSAMLGAIGDSMRWRILAELSGGESLMVVEIAERIGRKPSLVSKHIGVLRRAGLVWAGRSGLYQIPKQFLASPTERLVDYGHCMLRMAAEQE